MKKYCNVAEMVTKAIREYCADVRGGAFPSDEYCYHMLAGEEQKFLDLMKKSG